MSDSLQRLQSALGYTFHDPALLGQALTHRSIGSDNNERLEFLGDTLLNTAISVALFTGHTRLDEGTLTRLRARLVNQEALAVVAGGLALGDYLRLGPGELKSGGQQRSSILADALEAVLGAVFLDSGYASVSKVILHLFNQQLSSPTLPETLKDSKTRLQEGLQARGLPRPSYSVEAVTGEEHAQTFHILCEIETIGIRTQGTGSSRRAAEQDAAERALALMPHA